MELLWSYDEATRSPGPPRAEGGLRRWACMSFVCAGLGASPRYDLNHDR